MTVHRHFQYFEVHSKILIFSNSGRFFYGFFSFFGNYQWRSIMCFKILPILRYPHHLIPHLPRWVSPCESHRNGRSRHHIPIYLNLYSLMIIGQSDLFSSHYHPVPFRFRLLRPAIQFCNITISVFISPQSPTWFEWPISPFSSPYPSLELFMSPQSPALPGHRHRAPLCRHGQTHHSIVSNLENFVEQSCLTASRPSTEIRLMFRTQLLPDLSGSYVAPHRSPSVWMSPLLIFLTPVSWSTLVVESPHPFLHSPLDASCATCDVPASPRTPLTPSSSPTLILTMSEAWLTASTDVSSSELTSTSAEVNINSCSLERIRPGLSHLHLRLSVSINHCSKGDRAVTECFMFCFSLY